MSNSPHPADVSLNEVCRHLQHINRRAKTVTNPQERRYLYEMKTLMLRELHEKGKVTSVTRVESPPKLKCDACDWRGCWAPTEEGLSALPRCAGCGRLLWPVAQPQGPAWPLFEFVIGDHLFHVPQSACSEWLRRDDVSAVRYEEKAPAGWPLSVAELMARSSEEAITSALRALAKFSSRN